MNMDMILHILLGKQMLTFALLRISHHHNFCDRLELVDQFTVEFIPDVETSEKTKKKHFLRSRTC